MHTCPLCLSLDSRPLDQGPGPSLLRPLSRCLACDLVFIVDGAALPQPEEKKRYETHNNDIGDPSYLNYLQSLWVPLLEEYKKTTKNGLGSIPVLDYGCGPTEGLKALLSLENQSPFEVRSYDPYFFPMGNSGEKSFPLVFCCEVVEHFNQPRESWERLIGYLQPGGILGVRTELHDKATDWGTWYYPRDPTHVCFYSQKTLMWLSRHFEMSLSLLDERRVLFLKPDA